MAQMVNDNVGSPARRTTGGVLDGAKAFALVAGVLVALIAFAGAIVYYVVSAIADPGVLTVVFCIVGIGVIAAAMGVGLAAVYFIRNMGKALTDQQTQNQQAMTTAFVQLVTETRTTNQINQQLLQRNLSLPGATMSINQLPPPRQIGGLVSVTPNQMVSREELERDAMTIYDRMYLQGIQPRQEDVRRICGMTSNGRVSSALDILAEWGVCTRARQGAEREWIYKDATTSNS